MRKMIFILICALLVSVAGCKSITHDTPNQPSSGSVSNADFSDTDFDNGDPPQVSNANLLDIDFLKYKEAVYDAVKVQKVALKPMYNTSPIDIFFLPTGEVTQFCGCVWTLESEIGGDYVMNEYQVNGGSGTTQFEIVRNRSDYHFAKHLFDFDFNGLEEFTAWMGTVDFQNLLNRYTPDKPAMYRFVTHPIPAEMVDDPEVSYVALDLSSGVSTEIEPDRLPRLSDTYYLTYDFPMEYYTLLPYYPASEAPGYEVPLNTPSEDEMDYAAPDGGIHNLNNILLLFPNGVSD